MSVGVDGNQNRVAGRDYLEINVAGADSDDSPLSSAQRQRLNALVAEVAVNLGVEKRALWREVVHARVGVESISEIPRSRFAEAEEAILQYQETERRVVNSRLMVARITNVTKEKGVYDERDAFCLRTFGERHLNYMDIEQLRQVLAFVEDYELPAPPPELSPWSPGAVKDVVLNYPVHFAATLVLGAVIGGMIL